MKREIYDAMEATPMRTESNVQEKHKINPINIEELDRGFVVRVGCQSMAFTDKEEMLKIITEYINNPKETQEKYYNNTLFN